MQLFIDHCSSCVAALCTSQKYCDDTANGAKVKSLVLLKQPPPDFCSREVKTALTIYCNTMSGLVFDFVCSETCKPRKIKLLTKACKQSGNTASSFSMPECHNTNQFLCFSAACAQISR